MVSIIVPAFNCSRTINITINSILSSGFSDYEILIVDDGSTDETRAICDQLSEEHACIRCIHQENAGVSAARNRGLREVSGDYVWFVDADDTVKPGSLLPIKTILKTQKPDMLVFGMEFDYYHCGKIYRRDEILPPFDGIHSLDEYVTKLFDLFEANSLSALWSRIIKRSVISSTETYLREDMFLYEDLEFVLRLSKHCDSIYFYREAIYQYRQAEDGGNPGRRLQRIAHIPDLIQKIESALDDASDKDRILLSLYQTLAREKINVSSEKEIKTVCADFKTWIDDHNLFSSICQLDFPMMLYSGQVTKLIVRRSYSLLRHSVANWLKQNIGDFRKW